MTWLFGFVVVGVLVWAIAVYNHVIGLQQQAESAWADVDTQLKRRHDLVPPLVETVKGYAAHERNTLAEVVTRRQQAEAAAGAGAERAAGESELAASMRHLFALAEAYPELRASERFGLLQQQLAEIEDHLQSARRYYNAVVRDLNITIRRFPDLLVARAAGFAEREFFELEDDAERVAPRVDLQV